MTEEEKLSFFIRLARSIANGYGLDIYIDEVSFRVSGTSSGNKFTTFLGEIKNLAETIGIKKEAVKWL